MDLMREKFETNGHVKKFKTRPAAKVVLEKDFITKFVGLDDSGEEKI